MSWWAEFWFWFAGPRSAQCRPCQGSGRWREWRCLDCGGRGRVSVW